MVEASGSCAYPVLFRESPLNPFRQIVHDTANLVRDLKRGVHHLRWRLSWWVRKGQVRAEKNAADSENIKRSVAAATKMCRECRALIPSGAVRCPECGAATAHIRSGGVERRLSHALPFKLNATMMLISSFFVMFLLGMIITLALEPRGLDPDPTPLSALMRLDGRALFMTGANLGELSGGPEPWRLLTAMFLHGGLIHLAFNTMAMVWFGQLIENIYGSSRMFVLFLVTGLFGNLVSLGWSGMPVLQVGASGAIFGLVGVAAVYGFTHKDALADALRGMIFRVIMWAVILSFIPGIDNAAHFGGMLAGVGMAWLLPVPPRLQSGTSERLWRLVARTLAVGCAVALIYTLVIWAVRLR
jgi:rhomboid protease GluP